MGGAQECLQMVRASTDPEHAHHSLLPSLHWVLLAGMRHTGKPETHHPGEYGLVAACEVSVLQVLSWWQNWR